MAFVLLLEKSLPPPGCRAREQPCVEALTAANANSPVYGVIFLFRYPTGSQRSDVPQDGTFDHDAGEKLFFAAQTIQNACGTQALLSVLLNKDGQIDIGPQLRDFKDFTAAFPSEVGAPTPPVPPPHRPISTCRMQGAQRKH